MEKKLKLNHDPPKVTTVSFVVENGMQQSPMIEADLILSSYGSHSWDGPTSSTSTNIYGDYGWDGGSSSSQNSDYGSGSWDF